MAQTANDQPLNLGDRVTITDRLVRVELEYPLVEEALALMGVEARRARRWQDWSGAWWRLWVPLSWAGPRLHKGLTLTRGAVTTDMPLEGVASGQVTLQQGCSILGGYEDPTEWVQHGSTRAYRIAYNLNRQPVNVTPDMIEEATRWLNQ